VSTKDDPNIRLPVQEQLTGSKFSDLLILKVAGSWEKEIEWSYTVKDIAEGAYFPSPSSSA
jgi:hypothetical protein